MTNNNTSDDKFLIDRIEEGHPKFLEAVKDSSPLAVLGSLCIAVSGFTGNNFPQAQPFAITAATLFLIAFVTSLAFKILPRTNYSPVFPLTTYVTTALGIVMLFAVLYYFGKQIPLVSDTLATTIPLMVAIVGTIAIVVLWGVRLKLKSKLGRLPIYFELINLWTILSTAIWTAYSILSAINSFFHISITFGSLLIIENLGATIGLGYLFLASLFFYAIAAKKMSRAHSRKKLIASTDDDEFIGCRY